MYVECMPGFRLVLFNWQSQFRCITVNVDHFALIDVELMQIELYLAATNYAILQTTVDNVPAVDSVASTRFHSMEFQRCHSKILYIAVASIRCHEVVPLLTQYIAVASVSQ